MLPDFRLTRAAAAVCLCWCALAPPALAQPGRTVLVVANDAVTGSCDIAERYATVRNIPREQILHLTAPAAEMVSRPDFEAHIAGPIAAWLAANAAQDRILSIVLTRGVPLRIAGTIGRQGTTASVDSELTLLYRRMTGVAIPPGGAVPNPYFLGDAPVETARSFTRAEHDIYLVTRLDGFSIADAAALIDRGQANAAAGRILLDELPLLSDPRNKWLAAAAERLAAAGLADRVVHETTSLALQKQAGVLGYYSWGSNDPVLTVRHPEITFAPGAIAAMYLSSDARSFVEPPETWGPGTTRRDGVHAGSNQTLVADFVRQGITGIAGQVAEPYIDGAVRPDILFPAYMKGLTLAEAFYLAMPHLSWQSVVVGDPLAGPFKQAAATTPPPDVPLDPDTELPRHFSSRRLAVMTDARLYGRSDAVRKLVLRAEARIARADEAAAIRALEEASALEPAAIHPWRMLGILYENAKTHAKAADTYRRLLALDRSDVLSLNNLAYHLAVREQKPQEALEFATRAATLARGNAMVEDTLGWIHHLLGNDTQALPHVLRASRDLPRNAEVQLHAAAVLAAVGRLDQAARALDTAASLDPALKADAVFLEVEKKIGRRPQERPLR